MKIRIRKPQAQNSEQMWRVFEELVLCGVKMWNSIFYHLINRPVTQSLKCQKIQDLMFHALKKQPNQFKIAPDLTVMNFEEEEEDEGPKETEAPKPAAVGLKAFVDKDDKK
eukprot:TRINITY_DN121_c0_g1_i4.p2 TRINITY_DN121_c0_g1~~TRINITY_DN121_c0_g1_i4.p2  ORF type:complete len:111 (-),score=20.17 TRINITY_DN121_c0_g1_i4:91-423(-)